MNLNLTELILNDGNSRCVLVEPKTSSPPLLIETKA